MKHLVIGDVHGCGLELEQMILNHPDKEIVLVGDLFDRANDGVKVWELIQKYDIKSVCGNHEVKIINFLTGKKKWVPNNYVKFFNKFSEKYDLKELLNFCQNLPLKIEKEEFIVVHAGIDVDNPSREDRDLNIWGGDEWWEKYKLNKLVLFGHITFNMPKISVNDNGIINSIGLDTAACHGGKLTGYCPEENKFYMIQSKDYFSTLSRTEEKLNKKIEKFLSTQ